MLKRVILCGIGCVVIIFSSGCSYVSRPAIVGDTRGGIWLSQPWGIYYCNADKTDEPRCHTALEMELAKESERSLLGKRLSNGE
ncbi:hypothetical protein TDB9533_03308 [Thalassocella blandensis]|nr:hypothetical protein TDB9533_03308 [Thalassocella blandensis]